MTQTIDLGPATERMAALLQGISDDQLSNPTPCPAYTLGDLVDHVGGLSLAFTWAATKHFPEGAGQAPSGDASRLLDGWRDEFPARLFGLAEAWRDPAAWDGMSQAGGIELPGQVAGLVALNELVVHGWDLARSSDLPYGADPASVQGSLGFVTPMSEPGREAQRQGVFGPVVPVGDDASDFDRLIGLTGRDPSWSAPGS